MTREPLTVVINGQPITADMDEWRRVAREITARQMADREEWQGEQRTAGQVWHAIYWRHWSVYSREFFSYDDARRFLLASEDNGDIGGNAIKLPSGQYVDTHTGDPLPDEIAQKYEVELL